MSSNRLHNIFGRRRQLSKDDIDAYGRTEDPIEKNTIEQASLSSSFDSDAIEGWEDLSYDTSSMHNLDKKFATTSNNSWYWVAGSILIATIGITIYYSSITEPANTIAELGEVSPEQEVYEEQTITIEETDIIVPAAIDKMTAAPTTEQVQPNQIQDDFAEMNELKEEKTEEETVEVGQLPVIPQPTPPAAELIHNRNYAKEIYLNDLKLIDYREYRTKPTVQTKQFILSGTPANKEDKESEEFDATPQLVEVPYIDYINKSTRIFNRGNFKKSLSRFEIILETYPKDVNANFYAGVCLYNFGEYSSAIDHFEKCLNSDFSNFDEEALWLKALCFAHLGERYKARQLFTEIKDANGFYRDQAIEKLK